MLEADRLLCQGEDVTVERLGSGKIALRFQDQPQVVEDQRLIGMALADVLADRLQTIPELLFGRDVQAALVEQDSGLELRHGCAEGFRFRSRAEDLQGLAE